MIRERGIDSIDRESESEEESESASAARRGVVLEASGVTRKRGLVVGGVTLVMRRRARARGRGAARRAAHTWHARRATRARAGGERRDADADAVVECN